jgi:hypothetical protein
MPHPWYTLPALDIGRQAYNCACEPKWRRLNDCTIRIDRCVNVAIAWVCKSKLVKLFSLKDHDHDEFTRDTVKSGGR